MKFDILIDTSVFLKCFYTTKCALDFKTFADFFFQFRAFSSSAQIKNKIEKRKCGKRNDDV